MYSIWGWLRSYIRPTNFSQIRTEYVPPSGSGRDLSGLNATCACYTVYQGQGW